MLTYTLIYNSLQWKKNLISTIQHNYLEFVETQVTMFLIRNYLNLKEILKTEFFKVLSKKIVRFDELSINKVFLYSLNAVSDKLLVK